MSDNTQDFRSYQAVADEVGKQAVTTKDWLWAFPQPILVLGSMFLVAAMITEQWMDHKLFAAIMIVLPIPILIFAERIWTKRTDWLLEPKEMAEDAFWLGFAGLLWVPLEDRENNVSFPVLPGVLQDLA